MSARSSTACRVLACLVTLLVCGAGTTGVVAATGGSTALAIDDDSLTGSDETTDDLENETNEPTDGLEETVDETTDSPENTTDGTSTELDETTDEGGDSDDETTDETAGGLDDAGDGTTDDLENATETTTDAIDETVENATDAIDAVANETAEAIDETDDDATGAVEGRDGEPIGPVRTELGASTDSGDGDGDDAGATASDSGGDSGGGDSAVPDGTSATADAVLVGLLGAITATGAAAGGASAAGGAAGASAGAGAAAGSTGAGAAGGATGLTASWLGNVPGLRHLRRLGSLLPWEVVPIFRYSRYDDSDPLENDRRRTIYETIADEPGCYLSEVSERSDVALSTVRHHVRVLEEEGLVTAAKLNGKRRYYLDEGQAEDDDAIANAELRAALAEPAKRAVLEALADLGSSPNGRLAEELGRDPSTVSHHLSALEDDGLVVREKDGRSMVNELAPEVAAALREAEPSLEDESTEPPASAPADD